MLIGFSATTSVSAEKAVRRSNPKPAQYTYVTNTSLAQVLAYEPNSFQWLATFTCGAYTVCLAGPERTFTERTAANPVAHNIWIRTLPTPFGGVIDTAWMLLALHANEEGLPSEFCRFKFYGQHPIVPGSAA